MVKIFLFGKKNIHNERGRKKIVDEKGFFLHIIDDWIYYRIFSKNGIFKIRTDGTQRTQLANDKTRSINVVDNWIYFSSFDTRSVHKMLIDGTQRTTLTDDLADFINVVDGWIYYIKDWLSIYKMRTDGTEKTIIYSQEPDSRGEGRYIDFLNVQNEWIYYLDYSENIDYGDSGKIFKIRPTGNDRTKITDERSKSINIIGQWIYGFDDCNDDFDDDFDFFSPLFPLCFFRIRTDGTDRQLVE